GVDCDDAHSRVVAQAPEPGREQRAVAGRACMADRRRRLDERRGEHTGRRNWDGLAAERRAHAPDRGDHAAAERARDQAHNLGSVQAGDVTTRVLDPAGGDQGVVQQRLVRARDQRVAEGEDHLGREEHLVARRAHVHERRRRRDRGTEHEGPLAPEVVGDRAGRNLEREGPRHEPRVQRHDLCEREPAPLREEGDQDRGDEVYPIEDAECLEPPDVPAHGGRPIASRTRWKSVVRLPSVSRTTNAGSVTGSMGAPERRIAWTAKSGGFPARGTTGSVCVTASPAAWAAACTRFSCAACSHTTKMPVGRSARAAATQYASIPPRCSKLQGPFWTRPDSRAVPIGRYGGVPVTRSTEPTA